MRQLTIEIRPEEPLYDKLTELQDPVGFVRQAVEEQLRQKERERFEHLVRQSRTVENIERWHKSFQPMQLSEQDQYAEL